MRWFGHVGLYNIATGHGYIRYVALQLKHDNSELPSSTGVISRIEVEDPTEQDDHGSLLAGHTASMYVCRFFPESLILS